MAKLTSKTRNKLSSGSFALPGRRYPIEDESHARNALSRVSQNGSPEEKATVRAAVHRKFPAIGGNMKAVPEEKETPESEGESHQPSFLKKAARMATAKEAKHDGKKAVKKPARKR